MSIVALKRKTNAVYGKVHSHGYGGLSGFSINGGRRSMGYIGKDHLNSKVVTPFRGTEPMGLDGNTRTIIYGVGAGTDIRGEQYKVIKPSVVTSREQINNMRWCCADIVRTQSGIDMGSQDQYVTKKAAANICVLPTDKQSRGFHPKCSLSERLDCKNNYSKDIVPVDSSLRTLGIKKQCALYEIDPSKLLVSNKHRFYTC